MSTTFFARCERSPVIAWCALAVVGCVALGSLLPLNFDRGPAGWDARFGFSQLVWGESPVSDIAANVCVYLPVGAMLVLLAARGGRATVRCLMLAGVAGLLMSGALEWSQTMLPSRVASWTDVCMNVVGTMAGAMIAAAGPLTVVRDRLLRGVRAWPVSTAATLLTLGLIVYHLLPFDVVTSSAALWDSLRASRIGFSFLDRGVDDWVAWGGYAGQFALLGFLFARGCSERGGTFGESAGAAVMHIAVVALVLEVVQVFVVSHAFDVMDGAAGVVGGALGVVAATLLAMRARVPSLRAVLGIVLAGEAAYLLMVSAAPFDLSWGHMDMARLNGLPFWSYFVRPFGAAAGTLLQTAVTYGVLATVLWVLLAGTPRSVRVIGVVLGALAVASGCEMLQMLTASRHPDVTDPLVAGCVALAVGMLEPVAWPTPAARAVAVRQTERR